MRDWTYSKTISSAETYTCEYDIKDEDGNVTGKGLDSVTFAPVSETTIYYETLFYVDKDRKQQKQDVVARTINIVSTCVGAANGARWKSKLDAGSPAYAGTQLLKITESFNKYVLTADGPIEVMLITNEYEPVISFAGGLAIENYKGIDLGTGSIMIRKTVVEKEEDKAADVTKETTTTYEALGVTANGKTQASAAMAGYKNGKNENLRVSGTYTLVDYMQPFVLSKVEQVINIGRGEPPTPPTPQDQQTNNLSTAKDTLIINGPWGIIAKGLIDDSANAQQAVALLFGGG
jgi:hypothetical protein